MQLTFLFLSVSKHWQPVLKNYSRYSWFSLCAMQHKSRQQAFTKVILCHIKYDMGEIFRFGNVIIRIWSNDHNPPHVEAFSPSMKNWEGKAKFRIDDLACLENEGFSQKDIKLITGFLKDRQEVLAEKWREIHGEDEVR